MHEQVTRPFLNPSLPFWPNKICLILIHWPQI